jgi:TPR repeat protein
MRERILFSFLILLFVVSLTLSAPQTASTAQVGAKSTPPQPKWTEMDRQQLLAKARLGDAGSQMWIGAAYEQGWFGKTNFHEALKWFRRAAAQGDPDAQNSLGQMYEDGEGVQQNYTLAAKWYRKAAEHVPDLGGAGQGRNNLGLLYLEGHGVPKDYLQAYMWFRLFKRGEENLNYAKERMTQAQILEAERMAEKWKSHHHDQQE